MSLDAKYRQILLELLKRPENKRCAECGDSYPNWASANLGIFLCMNCASLHRSLGTHISFVRSVSLDQWKEEHVKTMLRWGNRRAREYWEARCKASERPVAPNKNFLIEKYDKKCYCASVLPEFVSVQIDLSKSVESLLKDSEMGKVVSPILNARFGMGSLFPSVSSLPPLDAKKFETTSPKPDSEVDLLKFF